MPYKLPLAKRRSLVKALWEKGIRNVKALQKITGFPRSTLFKWVAQLSETKDLKQKSRSGRPRVLNKKKLRFLGQFAKSHRDATSLEIAEKMNATYPDLNIAARTVRENLWKLGYRVCVPQTTPFLTENAIMTRITWAEKHQHQNWENVIFSDETTFQMFRNTTLVRYKIDEKKPSRGVVKHPFKIHVWGAFCSRGIVGFHMFSENLNKELYCNILTRNLFNQANRIFGRSWVFQHDNDPKHTAKVTTSLLENRCVHVLDWPSYSPDLNPIENLWSIMKRKVEKKVNRIINEKKSIAQDDFKAIIKSEWKRIDRSTCFNLAASMENRVNLVLEENGQKIQY